MRHADIAERLIQLAEVPAQAVVVTARQRSTRLGAGVVLNNTDVDLAEAEVTVLIDGAEGQARTTCVDDEGLRQALRQAEVAARARPADPEHVGFATEQQAGEASATPPWDPGTAEGQPELEHHRVASALARAKDHRAQLAGLVLRRAEHRAVANSEGLRRQDRRTVAQLVWVASADVGGGYRDAVAASEADLDHEGLAAQAAGVAARAKAPQAIEPGTFDVVLSATAVKDLLSWLGLIGFGSRVFEDGTSFLAGRVGERLTSDAVSLWDPGPADLLPVGFDDEGCARRRVDFVSKGVAVGPVYDRASAERAGCTATGHRLSGGLFPSSGAHSGPLYMAPGRDHDLVAGVEDGLYVERFHYVNGYLDPRRARMTGLTRDGLFRIRGGRLAEAVGDLRFTEDVLDAFSRIDGVSTQTHCSPFGRRGLGTFSTPAVRIRGFQFTGSAARLSGARPM